MKLRNYIDNKIYIYLGGFTKLIEVILELFLPIFMGILIDEGIGFNDTNKVYLMLILILVFAITGYLTTIFSHYFVAKVSQRYAHNLRVGIINKVNEFNFYEISSFDSSKLLNTFNADVSYTSNSLAMSIRIATRAPFLMLGSIVALYIVSGNIALLLVASIPLLVIIIGVIIYFLVKYFRKNQILTDNLILLTKENMEGAKTIRAYVKSDYEYNRFKKANQDLTKVQRILSYLSSLGNPLTTIILSGALIIILYFMSIQINIGNLSQGSVFAVVNYTQQLIIASMALLNLILMYTKAFNANQRLRAVLSIKTEVESSEKIELDTSVLDIKLTDVSFSYPNQESFIKNINLQINQGDHIGIVGLTSSGKSTLVNLIAGYLTPKSGNIYINDVSTIDYSKKSIRDCISYAGSSNLLLQGTIRDNLKMNQNISDEILLDALRKAQYSMMNQDLDRIVKKDGLNFSGGQRQRLNIARALSHHRPILVLDDVFSALDYKTDKDLRNEIFSLEYNPTIIIVSQRIVSIMDCNKIIVLDNGSIQGIGTHDELMSTNLLYKNLYLTQQTKEVLSYD